MSEEKNYSETLLKRVNNSALYIGKKKTVKILDGHIVQVMFDGILRTKWLKDIKSARYDLKKESIILDFEKQSWTCDDQSEEDYDVFIYLWIRANTAKDRETAQEMARIGDMLKILAAKEPSGGININE
jgi:hypothetical protein